MQRVNAPAGQMQLKSLIESYVVSELLFFTSRVSNVVYSLTFCYFLMCLKRKKRAARKEPRF
jgi:hypothetical protein